MAILRQYRCAAAFVCFSSLAACGWVDDTGRQVNTSPQIGLDDTNQYNEGSEIVWSFREFDEDGNLSSIRFDQTAVGSAVSGCSFPALAVADSLRDACQPSLSDDECVVDFNIGVSSVTLTLPELRRPAALRYNIEVIDEDGAADQSSIDLCIASVSEAPVAVDDTYSVVYLSELQATGSEFDAQCVNAGGTGVLHNDSDDFDYSEGWTSGQTCLRAELVDAPQYAATFALNADGGFRYVSSGASGPGGVDTFSYKLSDGRNESDVATVSINITGDNAPPVALNPSLSTDEDQALTIALAQLASDPENTALKLQSFTQPDSGTVQKIDAGLRFIPNPNFSGVTAFRAQIADASGLVVESTVNITVVEVNDAPVLSGLPATFVVDVKNAAQPGEFRWEFSVADEETALAALQLSVQLSTSVATAHLEGPSANGDAAIVIEPLSDGSADAVVRVQDTAVGSLAARTTTVTIPLLVSGMNAPPIAVNDTEDLFKNTETTVAVLANDSDPDGAASALRVSALVVQPSNGTASIEGSGTLIKYVPDTGFSGAERIRYRVEDADGGTAEAVLTLNVVNRAPVVQNESYRLTNFSVAQFPVLNNDSDPDGDALTVVIVDDNYLGTARVVNNIILYNPPFNQSITTSITYEVRDGDGGVATGVVGVVTEYSGSGR